jgi:hypothetical protein
MIPLTQQARERGETVQQVTLEQQVSVSQLRQFEQYTSLECYLSIRVDTPEKILAGKVKQYIRKWITITSDKSILDALINYDFIPYHQHAINVIILHSVQMRKKSINLEVHKFLQKGTIQETLPCKNQFVTHIFTRPKKDGTHRVILNLKSLNKYVEHYHFKMDSLSTAINLGYL